jgi:hypothetical protein
MIIYLELQYQLNEAFRPIFEICTSKTFIKRTHYVRQKIQC